MPFRCASLWPALCVLATSTLLAQTYTPKHIQFAGTGGGDRAQLLGVSGLTEGVALSKEQIEAAMGKLADSGSFTDLSYRVDSTALVITLTAAKGNQTQTVHFANFLWWQPEELEKLVEARVPLYHGELPLAGSLTDQVQAALVALLHEKGVDARVDALQLKDDPSAVTLMVARPQVLLGEITLAGAPASATTVATHVRGRFADEDFDRYTSPATLQAEIGRLFAEAGYLDAHIGTPAFAAPRKDGERFLIDTTAPVTGADLYRVGPVTFGWAPPPVGEAELRKVGKLKTGDAASSYELMVGEKSMEEEYRKHGFLDADIALDEHKDTAAHTVAYKFTVNPGTQYHVSGVNTARLRPELQAAFAKRWHAPSDDTFDLPYRTALGQTLAELGGARGLGYALSKDETRHTVVLQLVERPQRPTGE